MVINEANDANEYEIKPSNENEEEKQKKNNKKR